jgi:hypothetical protein
MARINSAAELDVSREQQASTLKGIRTTALEQVRQFCERNNLQPAQFMSAMGWLNERDWRRGVDWKDCVNWNSFNNMIFSNITPNRRGLDIHGFNQDLQASRESYVENATPRPAQRTARKPTAKPPARTEEAPQEAAPGRRPHTVMSAQTWANAYSQTEGVLDGFPKLTEEHRTAIHNIVDQSGPGNRPLVEMNLRSYLRFLSGDSHIITQREADNLFSGVMAVSEGAEQAVIAERRGTTVRGVPPTQRLAAAGLERRGEQAEAPAREERYVYRFTVMDARGANRSNPRVMSTFEIVSPQRIEDAEHLSNFLGNPPPGTTIARVTGTGERIRIDNRPQEMARLRGGVQTIMNTPGLRIELAEQERQGAGGGRSG